MNNKEKGTLYVYLKNHYPSLVGIRKRDVRIAECEKTGAIITTLYSYGRGNPAEIDIAKDDNGLVMSISLFLCNICEGNLRRTFRHIRAFGSALHKLKDLGQVTIVADCYTYGRKVEESIFEDPERAQPRAGDVKVCFRYELNVDTLSDEILDSVFEHISTKLRFMFHDIGGEAIVGYTYTDVEKHNTRDMVWELLMKRLKYSYLPKLMLEYMQLAGHDGSARNYALLKDSYEVQKVVCNSLADKIVGVTNSLSEVFELTEDPAGILFDALKLELANLRIEDGSLKYCPDPNIERVCRGILWEALHPAYSQWITEEYDDDDEEEKLS